ncbi:hypothetical protein [Halomonas getboli]|uniref:hypothetical protein n=1 Tax=Halomonas getboli TaxID=2935862 RepID=UPI001FFE48CA|nr:hypothetical protein [Halomonas getboli]MCK2184394.1 hypothetical protein [Halomonas getboli]
MSSRRLPTLVLGMGLVFAPLLQAQSQAPQDELFSLRSRWEHTTTAMPEARRVAALESLAAEAKALTESHPEGAEASVWHGIILASLARESGGLDALGAAKEARRVLESALEQDPRGLQGSAYVTLGALYDRAPGWPVAFGDEETAERMFRRAEEIRPEGIDVNVYYAAFLEDEGRDAEALAHARRALNGVPREGREASDAALRDEARAMVARLEE